MSSTHKLTRCDRCKLAKSPIIYLRTSLKVCSQCYVAEKETAKSFVNMLPAVPDREAPLGYNFIINEWFTDQNKAKRYADWAFNYLSVCVN